MDAPGTTLGVGGGHNGASAEVWEHDWILQIPIGYATPRVAYCLGKLKVSLSQYRVPAVVASVTSVTVTVCELSINQGKHHAQSHTTAVFDLGGCATRVFVDVTRVLECWLCLIHPRAVHNQLTFSCVLVVFQVARGLAVDDTCCRSRNGLVCAGEPLLHSVSPMTCA